MKRVKLFSDSPIKRVKLFSSEPDVEYNEGGMMLRTLVCRDCGNEVVTSATPSGFLCPKCGGKRFSIKLFPKSPEIVDEKVEEEEPNDTELEIRLKKFSGASMSEDEFQKTFSDHALDLVNAGWARVNENSGNIEISDNAYATEKLFSKITVTVTKEMDLDPDITESKVPFDDVLEDLRGDIPEKGIILIKKAHGGPIITEHDFSDTPVDPEEWLKDSRIIPDLQVEYYNTSMSIKQFLNILSDRYPDAPENLLDLLIAHKAIDIEGNKVTIHK